MQYILLITASLLAAQKQKITISLYLFFIPSLIAFSFIYRTGSWDYHGYIDYYKCAIDSSCSLNNIENSFKVISNITNTISTDYGFELTYLFYVATALAIKLYILSKYSKHFGVSLLSFLSYGYFIHDLTQIRASLAIAISWIGYIQISKQRHLLSSLILLAAASIHTSALIGFACILSTYIPRKFLLYGLIPSALIGQKIASSDNFQIPEFISGRAEVYLSAIGSSTLTTTQFNGYLITIIAICIFAYKIEQTKPDHLEKISMSSALLGCNIFLILHNIPIIPLRTLEFMSSLYPIVAAAAYTITKSNIKKMAISLLFIVLFTNTAIKNNARLDLVYPWQSVNTESMTDLQSQQFNDNLK